MLNVPTRLTIFPSPATKLPVSVFPACNIVIVYCVRGSGPTQINQLSAQITEGVGVRLGVGVGGVRIVFALRVARCVLVRWCCGFVGADGVDGVAGVVVAVAVAVVVAVFVVAGVAVVAVCWCCCCCCCCD